MVCLIANILYASAYTPLEMCDSRVGQFSASDASGVIFHVDKGVSQCSQLHPWPISWTFVLKTKLVVRIKLLKFLRKHLINETSIVCSKKKKGLEISAHNMLVFDK